MSGLGRLLADQQLRTDATMLRAQLAWDDRSPEDDEDDDALTEDQALNEARDELLATPEVVADALSAAIGYSREPVDVFALSGSGDPLDAVAVETLTTAQLLAVVMVGDSKRAMAALYELRERMAFHLRDDIKRRADDLLAERAYNDRRMRDDAAMDRYIERLEAA